MGDFYYKRLAPFGWAHPLQFFLSLCEIRNEGQGTPCTKNTKSFQEFKIIRKKWYHYILQSKLIDNSIGLTWVCLVYRIDMGVSSLQTYFLTTLSSKAPFVLLGAWNLKTAIFYLYALLRARTKSFLFSNFQS